MACFRQVSTPGIHDCSLDELQARFGSFQGSDRRPKLWAKLTEFLREAGASGWVVSVLVDGSFVTAKPDPNDVDLVVVVSAGLDLAADITPVAYNIISKRRVQRRFGFDMVAVRDGTTEVIMRSPFSSKYASDPCCARAYSEFAYD